MKFLYFLLFIKISLSNPISENNKVTLESVLSVIYKSIENQEFDNFWIRKIHTIEDVKKTCVLQKLQLENFDENPNLIIENPKDFSEENLKNRKIIFAIKKAAQLCFTEQVFKSNPWAQSAIIFYWVALNNLDYDNDECQKLRLQQLNPSSDLLEGFTTNKTLENCGNHQYSNFLKNSLETERKDFNNLEIKSCTFKEFNNEKKMKIMELSISFFGDEINSEKMEKAIEFGKGTLAKLDENGLKCVLMDLKNE